MTTVAAPLKVAPERAVPLHLGSALLNGDLYYEVQLKEFSLGSYRWYFRLEHRLENDGYGSCRSIFIAPLLSSSLARTGSRQITWRAPEGGTYILRRVSQEAGAGADFPIAYFPSSNGREAIEHFSAGLIHLYSLPDNSFQVVMHDRTVWLYESGALAKIIWPGDHFLSFERKNPETLTILSNSGEALDVSLRHGKVLSLKTSTGEKMLSFHYSDSGQLKKAFDENGLQIFSALYDDYGRVREIHRDGLEPLDIGWRQNAQSSSANARLRYPVVLDYAQDRSYSYKTTPVTVCIEQSTGPLISRLFVRFEDTRITEVSFQ